MSKIKTSSGIDEIHGKFQGTDSGYFYMRNGKQFFRTREETYQKNQSPRQKWNSAAFAYAHKELHSIEANAELTAQMEADYKTAKHKAPNGKEYATAHAWKFNSLLWEWKRENPYEG